MKKNIVILGSTGSIGKNTIKIIRKDKKNFDIKLLSTNQNIPEVIKQAKEFNVRNVIINDYKKYAQAKKKYKKLKINFYNSFLIIDKLFKKKSIFYSMISVIGIDGLNPSLQLIKYSKNIGIVNKESIICGWNLLKKNLVKFKTNFFPIDSEHFSIFLSLNNNVKDVDKIFITASGGPFLNYPLSKFKKITINQSLKHPIWKMGKKISVDSSTMMNKVFEVIEAKNIFDLKYNQINILTHPKSYVHSLVKFKSGFTKLLLHDADMKIPIHNSIYYRKNKRIKSKPLNFKILNNLQFKEIDSKKFPLVKLINNLPESCSLYETVLLTINDYFVSMFLKKKINYDQLIKLIYKNSINQKFTKYRYKKPKSVKDIYKLRDYVSLKLSILGV
jgi:1-deoxy-D-xylulose-5-phosphate reductoisomerase